MEKEETKEFNAMEFLEALVRVSNACCDDMYRFALQGVCIEKIGKNLRLKATDGHIYSESHVYFGDAEWKTCVINKEHIPAIKLLLKQTKAPVFRVEQVMPEGKKVPNILVSVFQITSTFPCEDVEYPDTERVKPQQRDEYIFAFNPELLKKLAKSLQAEKRDTCLKLYINKDNPIAPIRVSMGKNDGLLMPMRV